MNLLEPFRGADAVLSGAVTPDQLRGPRFRRLFRGVYVSAQTPVDLALRSRAALLLAPGELVLSGYSAAELFGADCAPALANAEVTVPGRDFREQHGLTVHRDLLADDEVVSVDGLPLTSPLRTAWDLSRWLTTIEAVVAVDALARVQRFSPQAMFRIHDRYPNARWRRRVPTVVDLADPRAESPMETRARLLIVLGGLPRPELQYKVFNESGRFVARLDMAYPELRIAVEYDGHGHLTAVEQGRDARRLSELAALGWLMVKVTSTDILVTPSETYRRIARTLQQRR